MVERSIRFTDIDEASSDLKIIREYEEDTPYPSCLALGFTGKRRPLHIVYAVNQPIKTVYIITVYEPEATRWSEDFARRIK